LCQLGFLENLIQHFLTERQKLGQGQADFRSAKIIWYSYLFVELCIARLPATEREDGHDDGDIFNQKREFDYG
jgi:hypothetical protein